LGGDATSRSGPPGGHRTFRPANIAKQLRVSSTGDGFAVTVMSKDSDAAKEILRRAEALRVQ
jgi:hypothetical protein